MVLLVHLFGFISSFTFERRWAGSCKLFSSGRCIFSSYLKYVLPCCVFLSLSVSLSLSLVLFLMEWNGMTDEVSVWIELRSCTQTHALTRAQQDKQHYNENIKIIVSSDCRRRKSLLFDIFSLFFRECLLTECCPIIVQRDSTVTLCAFFHCIPSLPTSKAV